MRIQKVNTNMKYIFRCIFFIDIDHKKINHTKELNIHTIK